MFIDILDSHRAVPGTVIGRTLRRRNTLIQGDARQVLDVLPSKSVQCVVTSPPYWGVRNYGVRQQIGLEVRLQSYLEELVAAFNEIKRVLKDNGVMWINIGDVYASGDRKYRAPDTKYPQRALKVRPPTPPGLKRKDLIGIPWRLAFALQESGWYLRTEVVWQKTNAMPESVRDRPSRCHEYLFLFAKEEHYRFSRRRLETSAAAVRRTVWTIPTAASARSGHHAVFPENLVLPCIEASTHKNDLVLDPFCGIGTVGRVCGRIDRRFLGIEINPRYARIAVERLGPGTNWLRSVSH